MSYVVSTGTIVRCRGGKRFDEPSLRGVLAEQQVRKWHKPLAEARGSSEGQKTEIAHRTVRIPAQEKSV
jgi:hypothetical protein